MEICCCDELGALKHTNWIAVATPIHHPKSVRNRCVIEVFCCFFCVVTSVFEFSVGIGHFVIGLSQIFTFVS